MVKTISNNNGTDFENEVNQLLNNGYRISSSSCGYVGEVGHSVYDCEYYMAILVKDDAVK